MMDDGYFCNDEEEFGVGEEESGGRYGYELPTNYSQAYLNVRRRQPPARSVMDVRVRK